MEEETASGELSSFWDSGIYRLAGSSGAVFMDPVRVLSKSYTRHRLRPSSYYSRSFYSANEGAAAAAAARGDGEGDKKVSASACAPRKRKRKKKGMPRDLNERERAAERRHQEARPFLLKAHEYFLRATELLSVLPAMIKDGQLPEVEEEGPEINFVELGILWQASQCEISLCFRGTQSGSGLCCARTVMPLFDNSICNETDDDLEAEFFNNKLWFQPNSCGPAMGKCKCLSEIIVKPDGSMIGDLDLFHHRPYECLVLGYVNGKGVDSGPDTTYRLPQNNRVIVTMPSAYSRKPPLGSIRVCH